MMLSDKILFIPVEQHVKQKKTAIFLMCMIDTIRSR